MKLRSKLFALVGLLVLAYLVLITFFSSVYVEEVGILFEKDKADHREEVLSIVSLKSDAIAGFDKDYSKWDDMVSWIASHDRLLASENLDAALPAFQSDILWLYGPGGELIYSFSLLGEYPLANAPLYKSAIDELHDGKYIKYYSNTAAGLLEIHGSIVVPTDDVDRETEPKGYFFVGKLWSQAYLDNLSDITKAKISLADEDYPAETYEQLWSWEQDPTIKTAFPLEDLDGKQVKYVHIEKTSAVIEEILKASRNIFMISFLSVGAGILFIFFAIYTFVIKPLRKIDRSLKETNESHISSLKVEQDELGEIARALSLFFRQNYELANAKTKIETLIQSIGDGIIAIDTNWDIVEWNSAAEHISGWRKEEVVGRQFRDYVHFIRERDRSENLIFIEEAMLYGKVKTMSNHTFLVRKDGSEVSIGNSAAPVFDENKKVTGVIIVFRDVSGELESQSLKTDFKYAAHQMRTPVTKVLWDVELAMDAEDAGRRQELLKEAYDAARSISKMSDQLLAVTEIDQSIVIPKYDTTDIAFTTERMLAEFKTDAENKKIKISFVNKADSKIEVDNNLFKRVVLELIDNAIKYNLPNGEVIIIMTDEGGQVLMEIRDSGIGILEEQQPLIFTKFFRGANYDTTKIPGAGIGLFISRSYVNLLKGKIWFKSELGKGTSFFVLLPKKKQ